MKKYTEAEYKGDPVEIINGKPYYVVDDRFYIPPEIMAMSKEELEARIAEYEASLKDNKQKQDIA